MSYKAVIRIIQTYVPAEEIEAAMDEVNTVFNITQTDRQGQIIEIVTRQLGISIAAIRGKSRKGEVVWARHVLAYCLRKFIGSKSEKSKGKMQLKEIGKMLGGRDHSTIHNSIQTVKDLTDVDRLLREQVMDIERRIRELDS